MFHNTHIMMFRTSASKNLLFWQVHDVFGAFAANCSLCTFIGLSFKFKNCKTEPTKKKLHTEQGLQAPSVNLVHFPGGTSICNSGVDCRFACQSAGDLDPHRIVERFSHRLTFRALPGELGWENMSFFVDSFFVITCICCLCATVHNQPIDRSLE